MSLGRVVSVLVARPRDPSSSQTGGFLLHKQTKRVLSIHLLSQNRRPQLFPLNSIIARRRLESSVGFRLMWRRAGEKGNRPTCPCRESCDCGGVMIKTTENTLLCCQPGFLPFRSFPLTPTRPATTPEPALWRASPNIALCSLKKNGSPSSAQVGMQPVTSIRPGCG
ncbi:hypothetical protein TcCL_ESM10536 [Trypanosoma cruzi]|nr:hypothetical protein TcCL_ESM10536 [Trypanosoma cruzi]